MDAGARAMQGMFENARKISEPRKNRKLKEDFPRSNCRERA
jgi:hypothetical protein